MNKERGSLDPIASRFGFFYGWVMLAITTVTQICTSPGQTYGISAFNNSFRESLGLSDTSLTGAYMLGTLLASLPMTYVGAMFDRYGARRTLSGIVFVFGLTCIATSRVSGLVTLFLAFLFLRMCGQGAMGLIATNTDAMWFRRRLGTAVGIKRVVGSLLMGTIPPLHIWLIGIFGWRNAYAILGLSVWIIMGCALLILFRDRPESIGLLPDGASPGEENRENSANAVEQIDFTVNQALRTRAYWVMAIASSLWSMIGTGITFNLQPIFMEHGFTVENAAMWFTISSVASAITFLISGILADRVRLNFLLSFGLIGLISGILLLIYFPSVLVGYASAVALGIGHSFFFTILATLYVRFYGRTHLGKIRGTMTTILVASSALGPFVMGFLNDQFGGYGVSLWVFAAVVAPMIFLAFLATPPKTPYQVDSQMG
ncbi:MFS transporter [Candidatus Poribacteria bacterium]